MTHDILYISLQLPHSLELGIGLSLCLRHDKHHEDGVDGADEAEVEEEAPGPQKGEQPVRDLQGGGDGGDSYWRSLDCPSYQVLTCTAMKMKANCTVMRVPVTRDIRSGENHSPARHSSETPYCCCRGLGTEVIQAVGVGSLLSGTPLTHEDPREASDGHPEGEHEDEDEGDHQPGGGGAGDGQGHVRLPGSDRGHMGQGARELELLHAVARTKMADYCSRPDYTILYYT